jgi:hypothetical protein
MERNKKEAERLHRILMASKEEWPTAPFVLLRFKSPDSAEGGTQKEPPKNRRREEMVKEIKRKKTRMSDEDKLMFYGGIVKMGGKLTQSEFVAYLGAARRLGEKLDIREIGEAAGLSEENITTLIKRQADSSGGENEGRVK